MVGTAMAVTASSSTARQSSRIGATEALKVLDDGMRSRRLRRQLASLEQDNAHDDPHAQLQWHKNRPKFEDHEVASTPTAERVGRKRLSADTANEGRAKIKKKLRNEHFKQRFRKNFSALLEEENTRNAEWERAHGAYSKAAAPPSSYPPRRLCSVCGFSSKYTCIRCGCRFCCLRCKEVHQETRCLKWTA